MARGFSGKIKVRLPDLCSLTHDNPLNIQAQVDVVHSFPNNFSKEIRMLLDAIRSLYQYSRWANHRILETSSSLASVQFLAPEGASYPSIHETLVHTMSAEWIWLSRWRGTSPTAMLRAADYPDLAAIQTRWSEIETEMQQFVEQLHSGRLIEEITYTNTRGVQWTYPLWQMMLHQVNHATQHRSEVAAILTRFGCSPGDLDYLVYMDLSRRMK
jgi:uncharacterized damage-inducible protein DinB